MDGRAGGDADPDAQLRLGTMVHHAEGKPGGEKKPTALCPYCWIWRLRWRPAYNGEWDLGLALRLFTTWNMATVDTPKNRTPAVCLITADQGAKEHHRVGDPRPP